MGRRPRDLLDPASMNPEQLTSTPTQQELLNEEIQKMAMRTHLEVQQREDIRRDLAERMKFVPPNLRAGENVSYWQEDPSKIQQGRISLQSRAPRPWSAQVRPHTTVGHQIWKNFRTRVSDKERQCCGSLVMVKNVFGSCSLTTDVCAPSLIGKDFRSQLQLTFRTKKAESFSPQLLKGFWHKLKKRIPRLL